MLALEIWHRLFVDDDGRRPPVDRVRTDFAGLCDRSAPAICRATSRMKASWRDGQAQIVVFGPASGALAGCPRTSASCWHRIPPDTSCYISRS